VELLLRRHLHHELQEVHLPVPVLLSGIAGSGVRLSSGE
jgi:hypothetical protein